MARPFHKGIKMSKIHLPTCAEKWLPVYSETVRNMSVDKACDHFIKSAREYGMDHLRIIHNQGAHVGNRVVFNDGSYADFYFESSGKPGAVLGQLKEAR
jgi:hypothetical protein